MWTARVNNSSLHCHHLSECGYISVLASDLVHDNLKGTLLNNHNFLWKSMNNILLWKYLCIAHLIFLHKHFFNSNTKTFLDNKCIYKHWHFFNSIIIFCLYLKKTLLIIRSLTGSSFILLSLSNFLFCKRCNSMLYKSCLFQ